MRTQITITGPEEHIEVYKRLAMFDKDVTISTGKLKNDVTDVGLSESEVDKIVERGMKSKKISKKEFYDNVLKFSKNGKK